VNQPTNKKDVDVDILMPVGIVRPFVADAQKMFKLWIEKSC
jgi:hypothetical protein